MMESMAPLRGQLSNFSDGFRSTDCGCNSPAVHLNSLVSASKLLRDTGLSQYCVSGVSGQDLAVHWETPLRDRTVPDFMVTFAWPLEVASMGTKNFLHAWGEAGH